MSNSNKNYDSLGGLSIGVDADFDALVVKPVLDTVVVKPPAEETPTKASQAARNKSPAAIEIGGTKGPEPTRYGDWEHKGRCYDF